VKKLIVFLLISAGIYAQETSLHNAQDVEKSWTLTPLLNYEYLSFKDQHIHSPGEGLMFTKGNMKPSVSERRDSLFIAGFFKQYFIQEEQEGYPNLFYSVNFTVDRKIGRHLFLGLLAAGSDKPFYGGLRTFTAGSGYGYEFIRNENISLTLGIGLGVGDFGIKSSNGEPLPVLPIPIVRFNIETTLLNLFFEFSGKPVLNITLFPEHKIRLVNSFGVNQFRDIRDFLFDTILMYRFFSSDSKFGDFAGIGIGIKNGAFGFPLAENGKSYEVIYNSIYGLIDLSFLRIYGGYSFNGIEIYDLDRRRDIGNGFFVNAVFAWQF
jgi:hypothetical protein